MLVANLFPPGVVAAEMHGSADRSTLSADESHAAKRFSTKRTSDFAAGRACARRALQQFGLDDVSIPINPDRRPAWPNGFVGSISHTVGFCAAAVAQNLEFSALGLDAELIGRLDRNVLQLIYTTSERELLRELPEPERSTFATIIFSAKEAFYKCQFAVTGQWLDFHDVSVSVCETNAGFGTLNYRCAPEKRHKMMPLGGKYAIVGSTVITGTSVQFNHDLGARGMEQMI
jgi:4'-phosphopantetheinyl transferase EntD